MRATTKLVVTITMVAGGMLGAQAVRADQLPVMLAGTATDEVTVRAEQLERDARELFSQPAEYGKAAKLLYQAAMERELGDSDRIKDLHLAARLLFYKGDECKALKLMAQAGDEALAVGDVIAAANHYADAAFLAKAAKRPEEVKHLATKSTMLAGSPLIDSKARARILARVQIES